MSYFFYEVNRAGRLPPSTRAPWRADTLKRSGGGSLDGQWEGGYFDAGDHNKFMLPQAYAVARLAWTLHAFPVALQNTSFAVSPTKHTTSLLGTNITGQQAMVASMARECWPALLLASRQCWPAAAMQASSMVPETLTCFSTMRGCIK
jgi:Glycosyl hydrolase family 9